MTNFLFGQFEVGTVSRSSAVFYGENHQANVTDVQKKNEAIGDVSGSDGTVQGNVGVLIDVDLSDAFS
ncbi:hypothetical protein [Alicyclobacillus sp. SP_1]|uniref:hypothetical protein n=1 Tax=Alicyclobacillus sp. SP_1 TaxID=2942475 RepID=UPI0021580937|nr:hypothetical protein [Alicyclobacillus sp. SP_1]